MSWYFVGMVAILFYLAMQNVWSHVRHRKLVKAVSKLSEVIGGLAGLPKDELVRVEVAWTQAQERANESAAASTIVFIGILIYLIALGVRGHF